MRCLWLAGEVPYPIESGLRAYSSGVATALARAGAEVTALAFAGESAGTIPRPDDGIDWRIVPGRPLGRARSVCSVLPAMAFAYRTKTYVAAFDGLLEREPFDVVLIDHLQMGWAAAHLVRPSAAGRRPLTVFVSQNHETTVRRQVARAPGDASLPRRLGLRLDAAKVARLEHSVVRAVDLVTVVAPDDRILFLADSPATPCLVLTPGYRGIKVAERVITDAVPRRVVMFGSFTWSVKQVNLEGFLDAADPLFARAGVELAVVGVTPAPFIERVRPRLQATTFVGAVDTPTDALAGARVGVVAERLGGGFKLKTLDYVFHRVPMAVLTGSAAGLPLSPGEDLVNRPDERSLAEAIVEVIDDIDRLNRLQERAYAACATEFEWADRGVRLYDALSAALDQRGG